MLSREIALKITIIVIIIIIILGKEYTKIGSALELKYVMHILCILEKSALICISKCYF